MYKVPLILNAHAIIHMYWSFDVNLRTSKYSYSELRHSLRQKMKKNHLKVPGEATERTNHRFLLPLSVVLKLKRKPLRKIIKVTQNLNPYIQFVLLVDTNVLSTVLQQNAKHYGIQQKSHARNWLKMSLLSCLSGQTLCDDLKLCVSKHTHSELGHSPGCLPCTFFFVGLFKDASVQPEYEDCGQVGKLTLQNIS